MYIYTTAHCKCIPGARAMSDDPPSARLWASNTRASSGQKIMCKNAIGSSRHVWAIYLEAAQWPASPCLERDSPQGFSCVSRWGAELRRKLRGCWWYIMGFPDSLCKTGVGVESLLTPAVFNMKWFDYQWWPETSASWYWGWEPWTAFTKPWNCTAPTWY